MICGGLGKFAEVDEAINVAVGDDFDLVVAVFDFGGFEADINDGALETINFNDIADAKLAFDKDRDTSNHIFEHILKSETKHCSKNTETGNERGDIDTEVGEHH